MRTKAVVFIICSAAFSSTLFGASLSTTRSARTFETIQSSLVTKGMAHACLGLLTTEDSLPCNPAHVPLNKNPGLKIQGLLSNGYAALEKTQRLLKNDLTDDFLNSLFSGQNVLQIEGNSEFNFLSSVLNARWTPDSVRMFGVIRNEANPVIEIYAVEEKGLQLQSGVDLWNQLYLGAQIKFLDRKFIRNNLLLISLATQQGRDALKPKSQSVIYVEPGATWIIEPKWKPRISAMVVNLGYTSEGFSDLPSPVEAQLGAAISPPVPWGNLDLTLDYKSLNYEENFQEKFHFGARYQYGSMNMFGGIDFNGISAGLFYSIEKLNAGIMFSTTQLPGRDDDYYSQTVYAQFGWQI